MAAVSEASAPQSRVSAPTAAPARSFLSDVRIDFGPPDLLGRLFLKADRELHELGIQLSFAPVEMLIDLNRQHRASWRPLVPIFDHRVGGIDNKNGFCLVGRNCAGEIVATQACRLYTLTDRTLKEECESLKLFYADPEQSKGLQETCTITCPIADTLTGRVTYTGAVWFRPDYRSLGITSILGRVAKAYAFTKWYTDVTLTLMIQDVYAAGTARRAGFPHHEWEVWMRNTPLGTARAALIWMNTAEMLDYMQAFLDKPHAQVDAVVDQRSAQHHRRSQRVVGG